MSLTRINSEASLGQFIEATGAFAGSTDSPVFLLQYSSTAWGIERLGGEPTKWFGHGAPTQVFEARAFGGGIDTRWVKRGIGGDVTCWVDDQSCRSAPPFSGAVVTWNDVERLSRRYLLWGSVDESTRSGVVLSDGRVGRYEIPVVGEGRTVRLDTVEYLALSVDGNAVVVTECLQGFSFER
jgi:CRISPR-associated protein (TIGR03984 family)